jgi:radical SAM protein with 4Fe4S-binding SPASM domain
VNVQFRPWRIPEGRPSISEPVLSTLDAEHATKLLLRKLDEIPGLEKFVRQNTNIAVNLLCRGARENTRPFTDCFFGLAKMVIRADGSLYPCFRMAAEQNPEFKCGNLLTDSPLRIALRSLYAEAVSAREACVPQPETCLFCVFNNLFEDSISAKISPDPASGGDFFF